MAKKEIVDKDIEEIRNGLKDNKIVVGSERVLKLVKSGAFEKVYVAVNCPSEVLGLLEHYNSVKEFELVKLAHPNDELGILCKKQHSISVLAKV